MAVHEEILRLSVDDGDDDGDVDGTVSVVREQLGLLKATYGRLGEWDKATRTYTDLYAHLADAFGKEKLGVEDIKGWKPTGEKKGLDGAGAGLFKAPEKWGIADGEDKVGELKGGNERKGREGRLSRRISRNWNVPCGGAY